MTSLPQNPDVIVVGAGVAGLSATQALREAGVEAIALEAAASAGGRCITDHSTFSVPFDRGGSWLHSASANPLARIAEDRGVTLHKPYWEWSKVHASGHDLSDEEVADYSAYQAGMWPAIREAADDGQDGTTAAALPDGPWRSTASRYIAQMLGGDAEDTSVRDVANFHDTEGDWLVEGGLGAFVQGLHGDVPVRCGCPVQEIDTSGPLARVSTSQGMLEAHAVIVTVSTAVLATETIRFVPALPVPKQEAVAMLPTGLLNKVGLEFDPAWQAAAQGDMADYHSGDSEFCSILFGFYGTGLATGFVAGRFADALEQDGPGAATAYCREALRHFFGSGIDASVRRTSETAWRSNANTLGSYSHARPGGAGHREILAQPVGNSLFFAGEATMTTTFATVHGAYLSGRSTAQQVLAQIRTGFA